jgi:hypothetical protein
MNTEQNQTMSPSDASLAGSKNPPYPMSDLLTEAEITKIMEDIPRKEWHEIRQWGVERGRYGGLFKDTKRADEFKVQIDTTLRAWASKQNEEWASQQQGTENSPPTQSGFRSQQQGSSAPDRRLGTSIGGSKNTGKKYPMSDGALAEAGTTRMMESTPGKRERKISLLNYRQEVCIWDGKRQQRLAQALPAIDTTVGELGLKPEADWIPQQKETVNSIPRPSDAGSQPQGSFAPDGTHNPGASLRLDMRPIPEKYVRVSVPW